MYGKGRWRYPAQGAAATVGPIAAGGWGKDGDFIGPIGPMPLCQVMDSGPGCTKSVSRYSSASALAVLLICLLRLAQMQLFADASLQDEIAKAQGARASSRQFKTLRGKILDRHGEILAADMPQFQICINYRLSCFLDERVVLAKLAAARLRTPIPRSYEIHKQVDDKRQDLERIIDKCSRLRAQPASRSKAGSRP